MISNVDGPKAPSDAPGNGKSDDLSGAKQAPSNVVTTTRIAPNASVARERTRRERPQRLKLPDESADPHGSGTTPSGQKRKAHLHEPDIESFVAGCLPGVSFGGVEGSAASQRRTKLIRKRPLPSMAFLASTQLAAAERKRRNEERERQRAMAEEEAKKALLRNPIEGGHEAAANPGVASKGGGVGQARRPADSQERKVPGGERQSEQQQKAGPLVTTTVEKYSSSNVLMPPLLKEYLSRLEKYTPDKSG